MLRDPGGKTLVADLPGAEGVHHHADGVRQADGVGQLHLAAVGKTRCHDVLGKVPGHVGAGPVHLGGVLAGEGAAAVAGRPVGIGNDLPAGEAAVPGRAADDEAPGGVDEVRGLVVHQFLRQHRVDDLPADGLPQGLRGDGGAVLGGDHHRRDADRLSVLILHADLGLAVRQQPGKDPLPPDLLQPLGQAHRQGDGQGHQVLGLPAGVAEHHALVPGAGVLLGLVVHALGDVRGLGVQVHVDAAAPRVKAHAGLVVADVPDDPAGDGLIVRVGGGGDLAHDVHVVGPGRDLAGHVGLRVLGQDGVQDGVRDLVADLVGMAAGDGFGCENGLHGSSSSQGPGGLRSFCRVL